MKNRTLFRGLLMAILSLPIMMSCSDDDKNETETVYVYSDLPAKFAVVNTWFATNPAVAPIPNPTTGVKIEEGDQFEPSFGIGNYYYEIDIDDYLKNGVKYDVEFYLNKNIEILAVVVNNVRYGATNSYIVAEVQLRKDYSAYTIGQVTWSTQRDYQIGSFAIVSNSSGATQLVTAWYAVQGEVATREMDSMGLGVIVPDIIKVAFEATAYSNAKLWRIDEIELEHNYNSNAIESYYEMELENIINDELEAQLFFSTETGELLYSKEEIDDDEDSDDDKFVVNEQLKKAVEAEFPGAKIIDAEVENNLIEVEAIVTENDVIKEVELKFTMAYVLVSKEIETTVLYNQLPAEFGIVKTWFANNPIAAPVPSANTKVEITEGEQTENDYNIGVYYYGIEIDDYISGGVEYEVEFYLSKEQQIIKVIVNDQAHS